MTIHPSTIALLSGARAIVACKHPERLHTTPTVVAQRSREKSVEALISGSFTPISSDLVVAKSLRTYYLYSTGRVSQRKLAGREIKDTVRATSTDAAFSMFQRRQELLTSSIQPLTSAL